MNKKIVIAGSVVLVIILVFILLYKKKENIEEPTVSIEEDIEVEQESNSNRSVNDVMSGLKNEQEIPEVKSIINDYNNTINSDHPAEVKVKNIKKIENKINELSKNVDINKISNSKEFKNILSKLKF